MLLAFASCAAKKYRLVLQCEQKGAFPWSTEEGERLLELFRTDQLSLWLESKPFVYYFQLERVERVIATAVTT